MVQRYNPDYVMHAARFAPFARENEHGEFVKFSDYEVLKAERDALADRVNALAVENQALKQSELEFDKTCAEEFGPDWFSELTETPATDAALAAIQAQGVERLIKLKMEQLANMHPDTHAFGATAESLRAQINELQAFSTELREAK